MSIEFDRDGRFGMLVPFGVVAWPLVGALESTGAWSAGAEAGDFGLEFAPGICRGRAADGVLAEEGGEFLSAFSAWHVSSRSWAIASNATM